MDFSKSINCCLSAAEVLAIIAPVAPDQLCSADRTRGIWEAYWANWNDIDHQRLINQDRIERVGETKARAGEPGSMMLLFQVIGAVKRLP